MKLMVQGFGKKKAEMLGFGPCSRPKLRGKKL
jgi:hypothetical protein